MVNANLAAMDLAFNEAYKKCQELPKEAFSSEAPSLLELVPEEQRNNIKPFQVSLLNNKAIANLVRLRKLSLDTLLSLEKVASHHLSQRPMLKLFFTGEMNEATFIGLSITQLSLLNQVKGVIYLIDQGVFTVPEALKLNPFQQANFGSDILVYCLINDLITLNDALALDASQIFAIDKHKGDIITGLISVSDVINDPYQRKGPFSHKIL